MVTFTYTGAARFYVASSLNGTPVDARCGFVPYVPQGHQIALPQAFVLGALVVFPRIASSIAAFAARLTQTIDTLQQQQPGVRFVAVDANGNAIGDPISVDASGQILGGPLTLEVGSTPGQHWFVNLIANDHLRIDGNELLLEGGARVSFEANRQGISLLRRQLRMSFEGERRGLLRFGLRVQQSHSAALGIGPRFFTAARPSSTALLSTASIHYPVYDLTAFTSTAVPFEAEFDIAAPYERDSLFGSRPRGLLLPGADPLPTYYGAAHGHRLGLRGKAGVVAGFALAPSPTSLRLDASATPKLSDWTHYCTPTGAFEIVPMEGEASADVRLLLGLANLENAEIRAKRAAGGDGIDFSHECPAFNSQSLIGSTGPWRALAGDPLARDFQVLSPLTGTATTSWLRAFAGDGGDRSLSLQPEGMQAFVARADARMMDFAPARYQNPRDQRFYPAAPFLGIGTIGAGGRGAIAFEQEILARARRTVLRGLLPVVPAVASMMTTPSELPRTPQGFAVERDNTGRWRRVLLANTEIAGLPVGFGIELDIGATENHLETAFGRNRLCLITTVKTLAGLKLKIGSSLSAGGWAFASRSPDDTPPATSDPIVIVKYDDRPLSTLLNDLKLWTEPREFSGSTPAQIEALRRRIAVAREAALKEPDLFALFNRRLDDANWNGVLVLDAQLPLDGIPEQIRGLAAGLPDSNELPIHHFGIDITSIELGQPGKPWRSALFGVINHDVRQAPNPDDLFRRDATSEIAIWVPKLQLRVENDAVDRFECELRLRMPKMFDTRTPNETSKDPLILIGRHEIRVVDGRRQSIYVLEARDVLDKTFAEGSVIKSLRLDAARFVTRSVVGHDVATRFLIDGKIVFSDLSASFGLDLLGIENLEFTDLGIDLDFNIKNLGGLKFDIKYPNLKFDFDLFNGTSGGNTRRRGKSLFDRMPLKLRAFRFGDFNLSDLGYMSLGGLTGPQVPSFKFGFDFDLDLGSLGALAKKLERFKLKLILGWRSSINQGIAAGFKLDMGEGAGGLDLGLQGILRLTAERFSLKKQDLPHNRSLIVLAADKVVLDVLGVKVPWKEDQRAALFLFGNLSGDDGSALFEKIGWLGSFKDKTPTPPVAISQIALGQRIDFPAIGLPGSTAEALAWLDRVTRFEGTNADREFASFVAPGGNLRYAPDREWFVALKGTFFEFLELGILLRDPDLYGAYIGFEQVLSGLKIDLLYEKLGDGLGKYSTEIALPEAWRTIDVGAVAVTIGNVKIEVYSDGGFLVDLGFPRHVDYSRSFAVQVGPFLGKGGVYIGRLYGRSVPEVPPDYSSRPVFRFGAALRVGLGREFRKGPIVAGLSVSIFGVTEGMLAVPEDTGDFTAYWLRLQGEIGIIAEIEGAVDLKLIRARLVIRVWVATGLILESRKPITLYVEAGVSVSIEVEIGSFKVFGKRIRITITVSYSTKLRFEWHLPIRMVGGRTRAVALQVLASAPPAWRLPTVAELDALHVVPRPELEVTFNVSRKSDGGRLTPVIAPMVVWQFDPGKHGEKERRTAPMAGLAKLLVAWAALTARAAVDFGTPAGPAMDWVVTADMLRKLDEWLAGIGADGQPGAEPFDSVPFATLESFIGDFIKPVLALRVPRDDDPRSRADLFPMLPGIALTIGDRTIDYSRDGAVEPGVVAGWMSSLSDREVVATGVAEPLARLLFRNWCELLLRTAVDAATNVLRKIDDAATIRNERDHARFPLRDVLDGIDWDAVIGRVGRSSLSGLRVKVGVGHATLLEVAGLQLELPTDSEIAASIACSSGVTWLDVAAGPAVTLKAKAAGDDAVKPVSIEAAWKRIPEPTQRSGARRFASPTWAPVHAADGAAGQIGVFGLFSEALSSALIDEWRVAKASVPLAFEAVERSGPIGPVGRINTTDNAVALRTARVSMALEFSIERVAVPQNAARTSAPYVPGTYNVAGTNETQRRWLDDLFEFDQRNPGSLDAMLANADIRIAWPRNGAPGVLECVESGRDRVTVIRSNLSVERRPFEEIAPFSAATVTPRVLEDVFRATPTSPREFLYMLRRSAIVNSGGTYLVLPDSTMDARLEHLFRADEQAGKGRASIVVLVTLSRAVIDDPAWGNRSWPGVNAGLFTDADAQTIAAKGMVVAYATDTTRLREVVISREPDVSLLRLWRKKPPSVNDETPAATLARQFDMLEFGVKEGAKTLLDVEDCIPIGSEEAIAQELPAELKKILGESRPEGFQDDDFRYDVPLHLTKWLQSRDGRYNPYAAIGRTFTVQLNWRDHYGNRLSDSTQDLTFTPLYVDPLISPTAWPCMRSHVVPGSAGSSTFTVTLAPDSLALASIDTNHRDVIARSLERASDQLRDSNVELSFTSGLGAVAGVVTRPQTDDLATMLETLAKHVRDTASPLPIGWSYSVGVIPHVATPASLPILPISLALVIRRTKGDWIAPGATRDVALVASSLALAVPEQNATGQPSESRQEADRKFAEAFRRAFRTGKRLFRVARGARLIDEPDLWAVDDNVTNLSVATGDPKRPVGFIAPPLALGPMTLSDIKVRDINLASNPPTIAERVEPRVVERDLDQMLGSFLEHLEEFVGPAISSRVARLSGLADAPFDRVMGAKRRLLYRSDTSPGPLVTDLTNISVEKDPKTLEPSRQSALTEFRDACAIDLRRFFGVASVMVWRLKTDASLPPRRDDSGPKLYGRLRIGGAPPDARKFRLLTRGMNIHATETELAVAVQLESSDRLDEAWVELATQGDLAFEITHVERGVRKLSDDGIAQSNWLTLIPLGGADPLPSVLLASRGDLAASAPLPLRRLPKSPMLSRPSSDSFDIRPDPTKSYADRVHQARGWKYGFDLQRELVPTDEACLRVLYNQPVGLGLPTQTAADMRRAGVLRALFAFEYEVAQYWRVISPGVDEVEPASDLLAWVCARFAEAIGAVVDALDQSFRPLSLELPPSEDRFVIKESARGTIAIEFTDHIDGAAYWEVVAGEPAGKSGLNMPQMDLLRGPAQGTLDPVARDSVVDRRPTGSLILNYIARPVDDASRLRVALGRLDAFTLQTAWLAGSVRRNAALFPPALSALVNPKFIYRTPETLINEVTQPHIRWRETLSLAPRCAVSLEQAIGDLLKPVFVGADERYPVQIRADYESGEVVELIDRLAAPGAAFVPEPDPKLMRVGLEMSYADIASVAQEFARDLRAVFAAEPIARRNGQPVGRLVFNVFVQSRASSRDPQGRRPLLRLERLVLVLQNIQI